MNAGIYLSARDDASNAYRVTYRRPEGTLDVVDVVAGDGATMSDVTAEARKIIASTDPSFPVDAWDILGARPI